MIVADIRAYNPGISEARVRALLFERPYGNDFSSGERARIVATLT